MNERTICIEEPSFLVADFLSTAQDSGALITIKREGRKLSINVKATHGHDESTWDEHDFEIDLHGPSLIDQPWGRRLDRWHDEQGPFHLLRDDGSPACGASYHTTTGPYPRVPSEHEKCRRCKRIKS